MEDLEWAGHGITRLVQAGHCESETGRRWGSLPSSRQEEPGSRQGVKQSKAHKAGGEKSKGTSATGEARQAEGWFGRGRKQGLVGHWVFLVRQRSWLRFSDEPTQHQGVFQKIILFIYAFPLVAQSVKSLPAMQETWVQSLGREDPLEEEMATHSSVLAWRIPWTEEPGRLQSMGSQQSDTTERLSTHTHVFLTVLGLQCWVGFSPVTGSRGYSRAVVFRLLTAVPLLAEHGLQFVRASVAAVPGL